MIMVMKNTISKEFFLHLGLIASLYTTVTSLMIFAFTVINLQFPDALFNMGSVRGEMAFSLSLLIVSFPIFIYISKKIYKDLDKYAENRELWIRKWFLSLTLFLLVLMFAITVVTLIYTFLSGEVSARFSLKILFTLILSGFSFWFYLRDFQGYFFGKAKLRKRIINTIIVLVTASILVGLTIAGSPGEIRNIRLDENRVNDLNRIQIEITSYWQNNGELPTELDDISNELSYFTLPVDPTTKESYAYSVISDTKFQLCAEFKTSNMNDEYQFDSYAYRLENQENWKHDEGVYCFDREIDEKLFKRILRD